MSYCAIYLDNTEGKFRSGDTVSGRVHCYFRKEKHIGGVKLKIMGKEHTHWTQSETHHKEDRNVDYTGDNKFFHYELKLAQEGTMAAGNYDYPFFYTLPHNLPSSFRNEYGTIEYGVEAAVEMAWKSDYKSVVIFTVQSPISFNDLQRSSQNPVQWSDEKQIWGFCCNRGTVALNLQINKSSFVPGEAIKARIDCTNISNVAVPKIKIEVHRKITCKAKYPCENTKLKTEVITKRSDNGTGAHEERTYEVDLYIPIACSVYNFQSSELFGQDISIKATAVTKGCHENLEAGGSIVLAQLPDNSRHRPEVVTTGPQRSYASEIGYIVNIPSAPPTPHPFVNAPEAPPTYAEAIALKPVKPPTRY